MHLWHLAWFLAHFGALTPTPLAPEQPSTLAAWLIFEILDILWIFEIFGQKHQVNPKECYNSLAPMRLSP